MEFYDTNPPEIFLNIAKLLGFDVRAIRSVWDATGKSKENIPNDVSIIGNDGTFYSRTFISKKGISMQWSLNQRIKDHNIGRITSSDDLQDCKVYQNEKVDKAITQNRFGNVALYQHPVSKILLIDIDTHWLMNGKSIQNLDLIKESIKRIYDLSGVFPVYSEISKINRGAHLYYKVSEIAHVPKSFEILKRIIQSVFEKYDDFVECRTIREKRMRLPMAIDRFAYFPETGRRSENLKQVFDHIESNVNNPEYTLGYRELEANIYAKNKELLTKEILVKYLGTEKTFLRTSKSGSSKTKLEDIKITAGNRVGGRKQHFRLAFQCMDRGLRYDEFVKYSFLCNAGSKDLTSIQGGSQKDIDKVCGTVWRSAEKYRERKHANPEYKKFKSNPSGFYSNDSLVTEIDERMISDALCKMGPMRHAKARKLYLIAREFIGKQNFECHNPRSVSPHARLKKTTKEALKHGVQFPLEYVGSLKKFHKLRGDSKELRRLIYTNSGLFKQIGGYFKNPNGTSCKRFKLTYLNEYNDGNPYMDPRVEPITIQEFNNQGEGEI
ncbi:hypothetical protein V6Z05_18090 [Leptospira venezuelensis]|uniref:hypothetical protein n=1 Tax=Leptospira venezuelensis TaxID=1958811 RepID=UPI000A3B2AD2|nr:hypothetical protein [Leptospira venezuelensis]